jgi:hypothetical protein
MVSYLDFHQPLGPGKLDEKVTEIPTFTMDFALLSENVELLDQSVFSQQ